MPRTFRPSLLVLVVALLALRAIPATVATASTPTPTAEGPSDADVGSLRARPSPRPYDNPNAQPGANPDARSGGGSGGGGGGGTNVRGSRKLQTTEEAGPPRLDDPVLRWLPEMTDASNKTGTPISLIAGIMRIESGGDPATVSPQGAQGLMQVMPDELGAQGIASDKWLDPPTNVLAGAVILAQRSGGGWEAAAAYYFGIGCDSYGTCTYGYAVAVLGWANAYAQLLGDPMWYDVSRIPAVPDSPTPTPSPTPESTPADQSPTPTPTGSPTDVPTGEPTVAPTDEPTQEPTAPPTETPTEVPTEVPTDVPTDVSSPESDQAGNSSSGDAGTPIS
jgi:hypothetical protein